jgi:transposase InsO family protein
LGSETSTAPLQFLILLVAGFLQRRQKEAIEYLLAENRVLRARLGPKRLRFADSERRLLGERAKRVERGILEEIAMLASPATLLRWYRELVATKYDGTGKRGRVATPTAKADDGTAALLTMARENTTWGYTRLRGALKNVGLEWSRSKIARVLKVHGIEPAPQRGRSMSWKAFLKAHWDAIAAADFFSVEVLTATGLVRYFVFFTIELKSRRVHVAGISHSPDGAWMAQIARNLTDATSGVLQGTRRLIVDRDPLYTDQFRSILASTGIELLRLPPSSPNLNAYAERFVRSIREECLSRITPLGERHLRHVISEYIEHFHTERNHQGLGNVIPVPNSIPARQSGAVVRPERLGGLSYYHRKAA